MSILQRPLQAVLLICLIVNSSIITAQQRNVLWYDKPAANWNEALPIGNGYIGAMIFGNSGQERLQLNEATIWGGGPNNNIDSAALPYINQVRALLADKKYAEAQALANKSLGPKGNSGMPYQLAGNLLISFPGHENVRNYRRELDIENATSSVSYTLDGVEYKREYVTSLSKNILVVRLTASQPAKLSFKLNLQSPLKQSVYWKGDDLLLAGKGSDHENQKGKIKFNVAARVKTSGGSVEKDSTAFNVNRADTAEIHLSIATNFINYQDISADPERRASALLDAAQGSSYQRLLNEHVQAYRKYYSRVKLDLGSTAAAMEPTDIRIKNFAAGKDPQLAELYFQFGRYLLISCSQPGSQAANLQGIWNGELKGPWDSKYTININTEMNYWPAEVTQLSELHQPLFNLIQDVSETGKPTAKVMYGARGWVLHHNTDIWRITGVVDGAFWGLWPTSNAWLCQHLWEHYLYTGDKAFLKKYYPIMKGAAQYYIDALQPEKEHNWLVVSPSVSPEHDYKNGISVTEGATMDNQLVYGLFSLVMKASAELKADRAFRDSISLFRDRLPPMQIGQHGQLQEWLEDFDNPASNHRHVSHLYGLFPADQISPFRQPKLFAAAKNSLVYRGDVSTGWSMAWKINLWARLLDGNHAYKLLTDQIAPVTSSRQSGGTYPNLFDAHPPFQIDGNFGCTSGIAEMLLQSHDGAVHLLPALPDVWKKGSVSGLMARGGFKIDMDWDDRKITRLVVHSSLGGNFRIRTSHSLVNTRLKPSKGRNSNSFYSIPVVKQAIVKQSGVNLTFSLPESFMYDLRTKRGRTYKLVE
ncbi:glycoside hydrolase N-terminal domain-containing protein [Paradesertivirga mongoliensis]|uniref:Glycoside hydrolase N-terminal domain-containing protein n=1 Tax=Paradesertivirga mongoliensis TaxID=2100740 RepID=A0ABW4ZMY2_9SPHI|nr:glycoside hydrolase family 95 protein [Pedobacter mongoliensis]